MSTKKKTESNVIVDDISLLLKEGVLAKFQFVSGNVVNVVFVDDKDVTLAFAPIRVKEELFHD